MCDDAPFRLTYDPGMLSVNGRNKWEFSFVAAARNSNSTTTGTFNAAAHALAAPSV